MLEKFRNTKCYKVSAMMGIFYILSVIVLFVHAKYFAGKLGWLLDLFLMILLGLVLSVVFLILTGVAVYQAKKSKEHTAKPVFLYDISYIVSLIIFAFVLWLCSFIYITEIRTMPLSIVNRHFPGVTDKIDNAMYDMNEINDNTCGDSQENFAKCMAEQMKDVEAVNGNTIITKKWVYTISIKSEACELGKIQLTVQ